MIWNKWFTALIVIGLVLLVLLLSACAEDEPITADKVAATNDVPGDFYVTEVDGHECIVWTYKYTGDSEDNFTYSGLSCDWGPR